uniref:Uncharacterized protein n=1 Tax=Anguilla anguilla TaxID=7936 RepID=A0A0E9XVG1_ANGAN
MGTTGCLMTLRIVMRSLSRSSLLREKFQMETLTGRITTLGLQGYLNVGTIILCDQLTSGGGK